MRTNNKLREAIELAKSTFETLIQFQGDKDFVKTWAELGRDTMIAALAEPLRNYEVGTAEEQAKRMDAYCTSHRERIGGSWRCDNCPLCSIHRCELAWAQMPYVEKEGGNK